MAVELINDYGRELQIDAKESVNIDFAVNQIRTLESRQGVQSASFNVPNFQGAFLRGSGSQTVGGVSYAGNAVGNNPQQDAVQTPLTASNQGWRGAAAGTRECVSRAIITTDPVDTTTGILPRFTRTATDNRVFTYSVYYYIKF